MLYLHVWLLPCAKSVKLGGVVLLPEMNWYTEQLTVSKPFACYDKPARTDATRRHELNTPAEATASV